jgi:hypothetical protein
MIEETKARVRVTHCLFSLEQYGSNQLALFFWPAIAYRSSLDKDRGRCAPRSPTPLSAPQPLLYTLTMHFDDALFQI